MKENGFESIYTKCDLQGFERVVIGFYNNQEGEKMLNKLQVLEDKYKELTEKISDIEVINDQKTWQKYMKEHADLEPIVMKYRIQRSCRQYKRIKRNTRRRI